MKAVAGAAWKEQDGDMKPGKLLALVLSLGAIPHQERDRLIDNLGYCVNVAFEVRMTVEEYGKTSDGERVAELIDGYAQDKEHPVVHLALARSALREKRTAEFQEEIDAAGRGLHALWKREGDAFETDLRFLLGYCYGMMYWNGAPSTTLEYAEKVFEGILEHDPSYWLAAEQLGQLYFMAYLRSQHDVGAAEEHLERGVEVVERALQTNPGVYSLHQLRATLRQQRLVLQGFDPKDEKSRTEYLEVLRDWRESAQFFEEPAVVRGCVAVIPASLLFGMRASSEGEVPSDLEALEPQMIQDLEGMIPFELFAGRASSLVWLLRFTGGADAAVEEEAFARAVRLYSEPQVLHVMRIIESLTDKKCELAEKALRDALKTVQDDNLMVLAARVGIACGDEEQAEKELRAEVAEKPSETLRAGLGTVLLHLGKDEEALREWRSAVENYPDSYETHFGLGTALAISGDLEGSLEHLERARTLVEKPTKGLLDSIEYVNSALDASRDD